MAEYLEWWNVFATTSIIKQVHVYDISNILGVSPRLGSQK